jgi:hypothetical protein
MAVRDKYLRGITGLRKLLPAFIHRSAWPLSLQNTIGVFIGVDHFSLPSLRCGGRDRRGPPQIGAGQSPLRWRLERWRKIGRAWHQRSSDRPRDHLRDHLRAAVFLGRFRPCPSRHYLCEVRYPRRDFRRYTAGLPAILSEKSRPTMRWITTWRCAFVSSNDAPNLAVGPYISS